LAGGPIISSPEALAAIRLSRRHPSITQVDYLHLRALVEGLRVAVASVPGPIEDVLDIWCGSRPYEDLLPAGARCVGLDVEGNPYGVADVVSNELLPFDDGSFDLVTCIESLQYMQDPTRLVSELARVLRPGGSALVSVVFCFEYDRRLPFEARYTEHQLRALFSGWDDVDVRENGGRTVSWAVLTNSLVHGLEQRVPPGRLRRALRPLFGASTAGVNTIGLALARLEDELAGPASLPMNLTLTARTPVGD